MSRMRSVLLDGMRTLIDPCASGPDDSGLARRHRSPMNTIELIYGANGESVQRQGAAVPRTGETVYVNGQQYEVTSVEWSYSDTDEQLDDRALVYLK